MWSRRAGDVSLSATGTGGSIYDLDTEATAFDTTPWVTGNSVALRSRDGGIGSSGDFLEINSSNQTAGAVIALATNGVYLTETTGDATNDPTGDLNVDQVLSRHSDVVLIPQQGSIREAGDDAQADIQGRNLDLIATVTGSGIGVAANPIEILGAGTGQRPSDGFQIEQFAPDTGRLVAEADAGIYLTETSGAVNVLNVHTPTGDVALTVLDSVLAGEDLNLLPSGGQTFLGTTLAHGRIVASSGSVTASAGDNFNLPADTSIQASSAAGEKVTIRGGQLVGAPKDPDPLGSIVTIQGDVTANSVEIYGGSNLDYFDLINPAGINAPTTVTGNAGNDRFFLQAVPATMTIDGGDGANRYYVSSNAARSLFVANGVFDDLGDDLDFPFSESRLSTGTLATITAALTINTGNGGNGGTRDAIYLSAAGSPTALTNGVVTGSKITRLGNSGDINYTTTTNGGTSLLLKLGPLDDQLQVVGAGATTQIFAFGGEGDDRVDVGTTGDPLDTRSGIVAFFGEGGSNDTLNVDGVATPPAAGEVNPHQLTAIAVTGLGSLTNELIATHNELFGAGYTIKDITAVPASLEAAQLTLARIGAFANRLAQPARSIDSYLASSLRVVTRNNLIFDYETGLEVVYRVNTAGTTPIAGLTDDAVYFVSGADATSVSLVASLDDTSTAITVPFSMIGDTKAVSIAHLDEENLIVFDVEPTITNDQIVFANNHNLSTGQAVVYHISSGNAPIGGLTDGEVYYVIEVNDTTIQLAASLTDAQNTTPVPVPLVSPSEGTPDEVVSRGTVLFNAFSDVQNNEITFAGNHDLTTGQSVVYHAGNIDSVKETIDPVGGLTDGQVYFVIKVSDVKIKLASSLSDADTGTFINPLLPLASSATNQDSLTTARSFAQSSIANNEIVFASDPRLLEGQAVVYNKGKDNPLIGLTDGHIYYVKLVTGNAIQLALSSGGASVTVSAASGTGVDTLTPAASFDPSSLNVQGDQISFAANHNLLDGQKVVYRAGVGNTPIGGLTDGQTYYVNLVDATTVTLANTAGTAVTGAADNGSGLIRVTVASTANLATGDKVSIAGVTGTTEANGSWTITVIDGTQIDLQGSTFTNTFLTGGTVREIIPLDSSATATLLPVIHTPLADLLAEDLNGLITGAMVYEAERFDGVSLRPETSQLLSQNPRGQEAIQVLNRLLLEDAFPLGMPALTITSPEFPAAVYYAQRFINRSGVETIETTVENVNVNLSGSSNDLRVDSTFAGQTSVNGRAGTSITVGSSVSGLHPATLNRVTFIEGTVSLTADNIVLDDSGNDEPTTGTLESAQVTGLMPGAVTLVGAPSTTIKLGANDDTFLHPGHDRFTNGPSGSQRRLRHLLPGHERRSRRSRNIGRLQRHTVHRRWRCADRSEHGVH